MTTALVEQRAVGVRQIPWWCEAMGHGRSCSSATLVRARVLLGEAVALHGPATESPVLAHLLKETTDLVRRVEDIPGQGPSSLTTAELRVR